MRDRAVIFARGPVVLKPRWHRKALSNLGRPQPLIHHSDRLVMYIFVEVTLISQSRSHPFVTPHRPVMLGIRTCAAPPNSPSVAFGKCVQRLHSVSKVPRRR